METPGRLRATPEGPRLVEVPPSPLSCQISTYTITNARDPVQDAWPGWSRPWQRVEALLSSASLLLSSDTDYSCARPCAGRMASPGRGSPFGRGRAEPMGGERRSSIGARRASLLGRASPLHSSPGRGSPLSTREVLRGGSFTGNAQRKVLSLTHAPSFPLSLSPSRSLSPSLTLYISLSLSLTHPRARRIASRGVFNLNTIRTIWQRKLLHN